MNEKVSAFLSAAKAQPELSNKVQDIYGEAAVAVAARLSELSQGTAYAFSPEEVLNSGGLSEDQLDGVSGGTSYSSINYHYESTGTGSPKAPGGPGDIFGLINSFRVR